MITVQMSTSAGLQTFTLMAAITDTIEVTYNDCKWCGAPTRHGAFCKNSHRVRYCQKGLGYYDKLAKLAAKPAKRITVPR